MITRLDLNISAHFKLQLTFMKVSRRITLIPIAQNHKAEITFIWESNK